MAQHNYTTTNVSFSTFDTWANNISSDSNVNLTNANADFSPERLERYLSVVMEAGIAPVLVLTKVDLAADAAEYTASLAQRFPRHTAFFD